MAESAPTGDFIIVAAIDFGTTYSGYAYSLKNDPTQISMNQRWIAGSETLISLKTPTSVLVNPHKQFDSFGYDAENKFLDLLDDGKEKGWMFFRWFKMILHNSKELTTETDVEDINGKRMPAMTIFSMAINYMREHLMGLIKNRIPEIEQADVMFVITVPAIWNDASKQFMRKAAVAGGIEGDHIKLALEPECASIWCQQVDDEIKSVINRTGSKYMVADLGGGTVDVSVHEKNLDGTLKELHPASGGPWGGTRVDCNYIDWLAKMFGEDAMKTFKKKFMRDYFDLLRNFETKKRNVLPDAIDFITFKMPPTLNEFHNKSDVEKLTKKIEQMNLKDDVKVIGYSLRVSADVVRSWFQYSIDKTVGHITGILAEPEMNDINTILLVGGFAECMLVQEAVKKAVGRRTVIVPQEAELAVLKGAVRFGHQPRLVSSRCVKYTYGYEVHRPFNENKHPPEKMIISSYGDKRVSNCFKKVVEIGSSVEVGKDIKAPSTNTLNKSGGSALPIYASTERDPMYTTDPSCTYVGMLDLGKAPGKTKEENRAQVYFAFGDTELKVSVKMLKTGEVVTKIVDYL